MSEKFTQQSATGFLVKSARGHVLGCGTTVPANGSIGWSPNAIFIKQDSASPGATVGQVFVNVGTALSSIFIAKPIAYTNVVASTAVGSTATETAFDTNYSIPANALKAGTLIKIRYQGIATATNANDTLAVVLYLATAIPAGAIVGTALISHAATDVSNNDVFSGEYQLIVRTVGASGTIVGQGTYKSIPAAEGTATYKDDILASTAIDTTAAQIVAVSAAWSSTNAGNSCRLDNLAVEIY